jgi:hypothetical protein
MTALPPILAQLLGELHRYVSPPAVGVVPPDPPAPTAMATVAPGVSVAFVIFEYAPPPPPAE